MQEKYLTKNLGVREGGGHLLEGGVFSGTYGQPLSVPGFKASDFLSHDH